MDNTLPIKLFRDEILWAVRVVYKGDKYGHNHCLTHEKDEPLVEFYDTRFPQLGNLGQFVARYDLSVILFNETAPLGVCIDTGCRDWSFSGKCLTSIQSWLESLQGADKETEDA